jgi:hypothetical protein
MLKERGLLRSTRSSISTKELNLIVPFAPRYQPFGSCSKPDAWGSVDELRGLNLRGPRWMRAGESTWETIYPNSNWRELSNSCRRRVLRALAAAPLAPHLHA